MDSPNLKTLEHFNLEALSVVYESYIGFKSAIDGLRDPAIINKLLKSSGNGLRDNLNIVFEAVHSPAQAKVVREHYEKLDLEKIKDSYYDYFNTTCLGHLKQIGISLE